MTEMRRLLLLVLLLNFSVFAQTETIAGDYEFRFEATNGLGITKLTLNVDGSFVFHNYEKHDGGNPPEKNHYARGTWKVEKKVICFFTETSDFDATYTLNFNNTKARFIYKSPRDTSGKDIKTSLRFFESEISWIVGRILLKN